VRRWLADNTLTPSWLPARWQHPLGGYMAAALTEAAAVAAATVLALAFPAYGSLDAPLLLVGVVLALVWGAGPGLVATLAGGAALPLLPSPPRLSVALARPEDMVSVLQFLVLGALGSVLVGQSQRRRQEAQALARAMDAERARLEAIIEAVPALVTLHD